MTSSAPPGTTSGFPLALACLGISVFIWSATLGGWLPDTQVVSLVSIFTGGIGLLAAGIIAFREGAAFGGAFNVGISTFWFSLGFFYWFFYASAKNINADGAWFLAAWGIFVGIGALGTLRMKSMLLTLSATLFFLVFPLGWIYSVFHTGVIVLQIAGIAGILSSLCSAFMFYQQMMKEAA